MVRPQMIYDAVRTDRMILGQAIALVHHPPRITVHSVQDGCEEHSPHLIDEISESTRLTGVWWFKDERQAEADPIPDIFKRGTDIVRLCYHHRKTDPNPCCCESQDLLIPSSSTCLYWIRFWTTHGH
jgi:hypothetical protein